MGSNPALANRKMFAEDLLNQKQINWDFSRLYFLIFVFSIQLNNVKLKLPMDLNFGPLVLEATTLPTEPLPILILSKIS